METFKTEFGLITLYKNEIFIGSAFRNNQYWDRETLLSLRKYIDPNRNILEIGGHCGTSSIVYSSFLNDKQKYRPVILYENIDLHGTYLWDNICKSYPGYKEESKFDIKKYCMEQLNYSSYIDKFNGGIDTLLIP